MEDPEQKNTLGANQVAEKLDVVGIKFRGSNKIYYFLTGGLQLRPGNPVVASTEKGTDIGYVHFLTKRPEDLASLKHILRKANEHDMERLKENQKLEIKTKEEAQDLSSQMKLGMEFVVCTYSLDRSKATLYFLAEKRVDFREFVRELSKKIHAKVELWQIGQRDETRLFGGIGPCNREFCCHTFFSSKESVTVKDAKCQRLDINPQKITGMCGKLMCCLKYEVDMYKDLLADFPEDGETVRYKDGEYKVQSVNPFASTVTIYGGELGVTTASLEEVFRNYHGEWISCKESSVKMQEQRSERTKQAQEFAERARQNKKRKKKSFRPPGFKPQSSQGGSPPQSHDGQPGPGF